MSAGEEASRASVNAFRAVWLAEKRRELQHHLAVLDTEFATRKSDIVRKHDEEVAAFDTVWKANAAGYVSQLLAVHAERPRAQPPIQLDSAAQESSGLHHQPAAMTSRKTPTQHPRARMGNFGPPLPNEAEPMQVPPQQAMPEPEPAASMPTPTPDVASRPKRTVKLTEKSTLRTLAPAPPRTLPPAPTRTLGPAPPRRLPPRTPPPAPPRTVAPAPPPKRARSSSPAPPRRLTTAYAKAPAELSADLEFCHEMLKYLMENDHAATFQHPVDHNEYPDYYQQIKKPMNLGTIKHHLEQGVYVSSAEFKADFMLMIDNCCTYNPVGNPIRERAIDFRRVFQHLWNGKERWERTQKRRKTAGEGDQGES